MEIAAPSEVLAIDPIVGDPIVGDPIVGNDVVISVDPAEFAPIAIAEPLPSDLAPSDSGSTDLPPDAQTFGGPVAGVTDGDISIFVIGTPVEGDPLPVDDSAVTKDALDPVIYTLGDVGTDAGSDTGIDTGTAGGAEESPGRPIDPQPEWRTLTGSDGTDGSTHSDAGSGTDGVITIDDGALLDVVPVDGTVILDKEATIDGNTGIVPPDILLDDGSATGTDVTWTYEDFLAIYGADPLPVSDDGTPPNVYTMTGGDPVELGPIAYSTSDTPSRGSHDPLPFERTNTGSHDAPSAPAHEIDPDIAAIHYAAADTSHTGLDLL